MIMQNDCVNQGLPTIIKEVTRGRRGKGDMFFYGGAI